MKDKKRGNWYWRELYFLCLRASNFRRESLSNKRFSFKAKVLITILSERRRKRIWSGNNPASLRTILVGVESRIPNASLIALSWILLNLLKRDWLNVEKIKVPYSIGLRIKDRYKVRRDMGWAPRQVPHKNCNTAIILWHLLATLEKWICPASLESKCIPKNFIELQTGMGELLIVRGRKGESQGCQSPMLMSCTVFPAPSKSLNPWNMN